MRLLNTISLDDNHLSLRAWEPLVKIAVYTARIRATLCVGQ